MKTVPALRSHSERTSQSGSGLLNSIVIGPPLYNSIVVVKHLAVQLGQLQPFAEITNIGLLTLYSLHIESKPQSMQTRVPS
jgi:hypothetical protein